MIRWVLKLFDRLAPLVRALDVDYGQFRAILETKLILDGRRRGMGFHYERKDKKPGNAFAGTLVFYGFMGLLMAMVVATSPPLVGTAMLHLFVMDMVGLSLIADFSSVLLDTTDNAILLPRPVSGRTFLVARLAHILVYLGSLSLSLSVAPMIAGALAIHPLFPLVYLVTLVCGIALVVLLANLLYLTAMRLISGERLRDLILYVQVGMSILILGGYQIAPRLIGVNRMRDWRLEDHGWAYVLPPVWLAAPIDLLAGNFSGLHLLLCAAGLAVPFAGLLVVVLLFAPRFGRALLELDAAPAASTHRADAPAHRRRGGARWSRWLCRTPGERGAFELVWILCGRDRNFKLRTYPSLGIVLVVGFSFIMSLSVGQDWEQALGALPDTRRHLYLLYMACLMIPSTLLQLRFSPNYEAAWVYQALPVGVPGEVMMAALKVVLIRLVLPAYLLVAVPVLLIWGLRSGWDLLFVFVAILFMSVLQAAFLARALPFSEAFGALEGSSRVGRSLALMFFPAVLGGLHYWFGSDPLVLTAAAPVLLALTCLLARRYARTTWSDLARAAG
jgi:hypothetical protein